MMRAMAGENLTSRCGLRIDASHSHDPISEGSPDDLRSSVCQQIERSFGHHSDLESGLIGKHADSLK